MYQRISTAIFIIMLVFSFSMTACNSEAQEQQERTKQLKPLDVQQLNQILNIEGTTKNGNYKIKVPQNDLNITVVDFKIIPPMGATSWVAFTPAPQGARIMGDVVLKEEEVEPVEKELFKRGLHATALHKHFEGESPRVMYMHISGTGSQESLAKSVRGLLDKVESLRGGDPAQAPSSSVTNSLDTEAIAKIIGHEGSMTNGVFKISAGRPNIDLDMYLGKKQETYEEENEEEEHEEDEKETEHVHVTSFTGFATGVAFQGTPENAAVAGDFAMLADEVPAVMETLVDNGIKVVSLHNHMLDEHPRIFFLHFWGTGNAQKLAEGLRDALDQTGNTVGEEGEEY